MNQNEQKQGKGIIMAVPQKYEKIALDNISRIRSFGCQLPIEIWEIGREISDEVRQDLEKRDGIIFKDVAQYVKNPDHWKGFQVKACMLYYSSFREICLVDADALFHQNPEIIFNDENYLKTGAYFFKDLDKWKFKHLHNPIVQLWQKISYKKFYDRDFLLKRKQWLTNLLPHKSTSFPTEWDYIYEADLPRKPVKEALQESGVVYINRALQDDSIQNIFDLNDNHQETYQYVWGDKETFWIGCLMAGKPFYFNEKPGYKSPTTKRLSHDYQGQLFFSQKG